MDLSWWHGSFDIDCLLRFERDAGNADRHANLRHADVLNTQHFVRNKRCPDNQSLVFDGLVHLDNVAIDIAPFVSPIATIYTKQYKINTIKNRFEQCKIHTIVDFNSHKRPLHVNNFRLFQNYPKFQIDLIQNCNELTYI